MDMILAAITYVSGIVTGLLADWYIKPWLSKIFSKWERSRWRARILNNASEYKTLHLGRIDTGVCLVAGDGQDEYFPNNLHMNLVDRPVKVEPFVQSLIDQVEKEEAEKKSKSQAHSWDGEMLHICSFADQRTENKECLQLNVSFERGRFFHFLATSARLSALFNDGDKTKYNSLRSLLINGYNNWRETVPPNCLTGLPANVHIFTEEGPAKPHKIVFSKRSSSVAIAPNEIAAAVNENAHPERDFPLRGGLDVGLLLSRALREETGWADAEHTGGDKDPKSEAHWLLFVADTRRVAYGLVGYVKLPISFAELKQLFNEKCQDRREVSEFIAVDATAKDICAYVHKNDLYNSVGVGALYSYVHFSKTPLSKIQDEMRRLQN